MDSPRSVSFPSGGLPNLQHLNLEPLDPNTDLDDINVDLSSWDFSQDDFSAGQPPVSHPGVQVSTPTEVHSRSGKRVRTEGILENRSQRARTGVSGSDPDFMNREELAAHLSEIGRSVSATSH